MSGERRPRGRDIEQSLGRQLARDPVIAALLYELDSLCSDDESALAEARGTVVEAVAADV